MPLRLLSDERLARLAAEGDSHAFAAIYERHHQALYLYCRSILGNPEDARDALQSAMIRALRALCGERREISIRPWLFRIAHNESVRLAQSRRPHAGIDDAAGLPAPDCESQRATRERLRELIADLGELAERQRGALLMRELGGLGYPEIAEVFGVSDAAAKQYVYEARTSLRDFSRGRDMRCEDVMRSISAQDRRLLRGRQLGAHLRQCPECRDFEAALATRVRDLQALAPPLAPPAAAAMLQGTLGAAGGPGGG
ncbi:MAG: RNA polymerase sigma factor, partial [Dehalococcoidia bacterium]